MFALLVSRKLGVLTICQNKPVGMPVNNGNSFSKISKPVQRDGDHHLQLLSADERLETGKFSKW